MRHVTVQQLSAFLDGALTGVSRELVTRHLAGCADCRERHALWHIYDEVLQRVLSWEPNERTMEEASARVELTLTAERRGLPPPEFTSVLQPVIATSPGARVSANPSGMFPALPPVAPPAAVAPAAPTPAPPPNPPSPLLVSWMPPPAAPFPVSPTPNPPSPPLVQWTPPPSEPFPETPTPNPPSPSPASWPPPPAASFPVAPAPVPPPAPLPSAMSFPLDPPGSAPAYPRAHAPAPRFETPSPSPGYVPPISVHEDLRAHPERPTVAWASVPLRKPRKRRHRLALAGALLVVAAVLATPWLPDVIRIQMPDSLEPRVPRVEFVHHGPNPSSLAPGARLAERTSSTPPPAPYRALPVPAESADARPAEIETDVTQPAVVPPSIDERVPPSQADAASAPEPATGTPPPSPNPPPRNPDAAALTPTRAVTPAPQKRATRPAPAARKPAPAPARARPTPAVATQPEDEGGTAAGAEHSMTFVPVQVKTEVRLSPTSPASAAGAAGAASAAGSAAVDTAGDQAMPLICGEVVDDTGAPIEGARVQLTAPPLTVRTDKRGRFCVACPPGERTFLVDAPGFAAVTRGVELTGGTFETHISLSPAR